MAREDAKSTLLGVPSWDQMLYTAATSIGLPLFVLFAAMHRDETDNKSFWLQAPVAAMVVSYGPMILAAALSFTTADLRSMEKLRYSMFYPFHNESLFGKFGVGLLVGTLFSNIPIFHFFHSLFVRDPNDTIYNQIWSSWSTRT
jgi:hypothetical protein